MPVVEVQVSVRADGELLRGFPIVRRRESLDASTGSVRDVYHEDQKTPTTDTIPYVRATKSEQVFLLSPEDGALGVLWGNTAESSAIVLNPHGLALFFDVDQAAAIDLYLPGTGPVRARSFALGLSASFVV